VNDVAVPNRRANIAALLLVHEQLDVLSNPALLVDDPKSEARILPIDVARTSSSREPVALMTGSFPV
jgi:hypothetical protein